MLLRTKRAGISRKILVLLVALALVVALGEYVLSTEHHGGATEIDIEVVETDPVNQLDHFFPDNFTAKLGENLTLAILNGDDDVRVFTLPKFGINETLLPGEAVRVSLTANETGTFIFYSPQTPCLNQNICHGKPGPYLSGNFTVT